MFWEKSVLLEETSEVLEEKSELLDENWTFLRRLP
jgi:hypothetical protein